MNQVNHQTYLRCHIIGRATKSIGHAIQEDLQFAHSKIGNPHMPIEIQQDIIQLQISVEHKNNLEFESRARHDATCKNIFGKVTT